MLEEGMKLVYLDGVYLYDLEPAMGRRMLSDRVKGAGEGQTDEEKGRAYTVRYDLRLTFQSSPLFRV